MPEVYASNEVTAELLDPIDGSVITSVSIPYRRDLTISERPVYAQRGYHRSNTLSAANLRSLGSVSLRKDADSLALAAEIKRWQKGVVFYGLSSDLKGKRYRHPHLRVTFTNADGSTDVVTAYNVKLSDRSLSAPDGGIVGDSISLDVLGGFEPKDGGYEPVRALDFHRTGTATYLAPDGTLTTAGDGEARIGVPGGVVRRNLWPSSEDFSDWTAVNASKALNQGMDTFGRKSLVAVASNAGAAAIVALRGFPNVAGKTLKVSFDAYGEVPGQSWGVVISNNVDQQLEGAVTLGSTPARHTVTLGPFNGTISTHLLFQFHNQAAATPRQAYFGNVHIGLEESPYQPTNATGVDLSNPLSGSGLVLEGIGFNGFDPALNNPDVVTAVDTVLGNSGVTIYQLDARDNPTYEDFQTSGMYPVTPGAQYVLSWMAKWTDRTIFDFLCSTTGAVSGDAGAASYEWLSNPEPSPAEYQFYAVRLTIPPLAGYCEFFRWYYIDTDNTNWANLALVQAESGPMPTSHMDPLTGRQGDRIGIVHPQNELIHSRDLTQSAWAKTSGASVTKAGTANALTLAATTDAITQAVTPASVPGTTRTAAAKLRLGTLSGSVRLRLLDQAGTQIASTTISTADLHATDARTFTVTGAAAADASGLQVQVIGSSGTGTVIVESLRLARGHHPGIDVETFDTPIYAPASPALDPVWQQNGELEIEILPPPITEGVYLRYFGCDELRLDRWQGWTTAQEFVIFSRAIAGGIMPEPWMIDVLLPGFWNGASHRLRFQWTNEIHEQSGRREMWKRIYLDDVLVSAVDVAALLGAKAWAPIDPSRLISDGNVFSVLSRIALDYPTPRAGYRPS